MYQNKFNDKLIQTGKLLGVEAKTCIEIAIKGCSMADREIERRKCMINNQILKSFPEKNHISSVQITQIFTNLMIYKEQRFNSDPNKV